MLPSQVNRCKSINELDRSLYDILYKLNFVSNRKARRYNVINVFFNNYYSGWLLGFAWLGIYCLIALAISPNVNIGVKTNKFLQALIYLVPSYFFPTMIIAMLITLFWHIPYKFSLLHSNKTETHYLAAILGFEQWKEFLIKLELNTRLKMFSYNWARVILIATLSSILVWYFFVNSIPKIKQPDDIILLGILLFLDFGFFGFFSAYYIFYSGLLIRIGLFLRGYSPQVQYGGMIIWNLWWIFWGIYLKYTVANIELNRISPLTYPKRYLIGLIVLLLLSFIFHIITNKYVSTINIQNYTNKTLMIILSIPFILLLLVNIVTGADYILTGVIQQDFIVYVSAFLHPIAYIISSPSLGHWIPTSYWFDYIEYTFKSGSDLDKIYFWSMFYITQSIIMIYIPYNLCKWLAALAIVYPVNKPSK